MHKIFFSLVAALLCTAPLISSSNFSDSEGEFCHVYERLVVDFPANERESWSCVDKLDEPKGLSMEKWSCEKGDHMSLLLTTCPWDSMISNIEDMMDLPDELTEEEECSTDDKEELAMLMHEIVDAIVLQEGSMPWEIISVDENEALITYTWKNQEIVMLRLIITPFALHTVNVYYHGEDAGFIDREELLYLVKDCCYLVY